MDKVFSELLLPTPTRALSSDDPADILSFAAAALKRGQTVALATLVEIRGGAAKALGSHVVTCEDGRFAGYVSGGCVEAAVAAGSLEAMAEGRDRMLMFGEGSNVFDIVLPCGGGISIAVHLLRDGLALDRVLALLAERKPASLCYDPARESLTLQPPVARAGWDGAVFSTLYRPRTRLVLSGQTVEAEAVARIGQAAGYDVVMRDTVPATEALADLIDEHTAIALLHHDLDREAAVLPAALRSKAFYIGALGSSRTHRRRELRLKEAGFAPGDIARIKAPIGVFGPTRDSASLALSVLADIAAARLARFG